MKYFVLGIFCLGLAGCGAVDRQLSRITGNPTKVCVDGVSYLQATSGFTVQYNKEGKVVTC